MAQHGFGRTSNNQELTLDDLQRLYLSSPNLEPLPPPTHQHSASLFNAQHYQPSTTSNTYPLPSQPTSAYDIVQQQQQQDPFSNPYSTQAELSISPSASSAPINLAPPQSQSYFDTNSFDGFEGLDTLSFGTGNGTAGSGAYTPSYGSWQSSSFGDPSPSFGSSYAGSVFSSSSRDLSGNASFQQHSSLPQQLPVPFPNSIYNPTLYGGGATGSGVYRDMSFDQLSEPSGYRASASPDWLVGQMDSFDTDSQMGEAVESSGGGRAGSIRVDKDETLKPSDRQKQREARQRELERLQQQAAQLEGRTTVFSTHLSESPPTSSGGFLSDQLQADVPRPVGQQALPPLAIPSGDQNPHLNLIEPTPYTAHPKRKKGKGTLELERALGELVASEDERDAEDERNLSPPLPSASSSNVITNQPQQTQQQQQAYLPQYSHPSAYPYQFDPNSTTAPFLPQQLPPGFGYPATQPQQQRAQPYVYQTPRKVPTRQRSKSEADMREPIATTGPSPLDLRDQVSAATSAGRPVVYSSQPPGTWNPQDPVMSLPSSLTSGLDLAGHDGGAQHELSSRRRSVVNVGRKFAGGPGYESSLAVPVDEDGRISQGGSHKRSRSHGSVAGHTRNAQSEDLKPSLSPQLLHQHLTLPDDPNSRSSSRQSYHGGQDSGPPSSASSSTSGFGPAPAPPPGGGFVVPLPPGSYYDVEQLQAAAVAARRPYVYHSPSPSPGPNGPGPGSVTGSEDGVSIDLTVESKTTAATIEAAQKRRNPGAQARFVCELCGETFTRRYNLRGHQRAHRNEKPFMCSYEGCEKAFARAHDCKRHELLHLGVRRYHCDPCQRDFVRLDALQRHHRSEVGQICVKQLREAGFVIGYSVEPDAKPSNEGGKLL